MSEVAAAYTGWAIVELMGHRRLAGYASEVSQYGAAMLRLDVPGADGTIAATQFYGGTAIYCVTPTTEDIARAMAQHNQPEPVHRWELPRPRSDDAAEGTYTDADDLPFG